jgi:hypothetical protein
MRRFAAYLVAIGLLVALVAAGFWIAANHVTDYTNRPFERLGLDAVVPRHDEQTGFVIGGKNSTALIARLTEINGRTIADLEWDMRPGKVAGPLGKDNFERSWEGFLGNDEKLLDIMAADNVYVVDELGLTHQELARHMRVAESVAGKNMFKNASEEKLGANERPFYTTVFRYHGREYKAGMICYKGIQESPFRDDTGAACDVIVINLDNGKQIEFSQLVPHMIERYGFYEGKGTPYRVEPAAILEVFDFLNGRN